MSDDTPSPLNNVITIDDERIKSHLDRVVRGTVEETLNALLGCRGGSAVPTTATTTLVACPKDITQYGRSPDHRCERRKNGRYRNSPRTRWQRWRIRWLSMRPRPHNLRH
jgi:hypothetical protein